MASDYLLEIDGFKGRGVPTQQVKMSPAVRQQLLRLGMTSAGITQLATGRTISNPKDQKLATRIAANALSRQR